MSYEDGKYGPRVRAGKIPLIVSAFFFALNFLIGDTIFANVIALFVSFASALLAILLSVLATWSKGRRARSAGVIIAAAVIIGLIVYLAATDQVAMGYGP